MQTFNACFPDMPRGDKIRLADCEGNDIVHVFEQIEKFPDAGFRQIDHRAGKNAIIVNHQLQFPLSSVSITPYTTPLSLYFRSTKCVAVDMTSSIGASFCATK